MLSTKTRRTRNDKQFLCRECKRYFWAQRPSGRPKKYPRYKCTYCGVTTGPPLPLGELHKIRWKIVSEIVRRTHADEAGLCWCFTRRAKECPYTNQRLSWRVMHAGHYLPGRRQSAAGILYDRRGIFAQCPICNVKWYGQQVEFHKAMLDFYGHDQGMIVCTSLELLKRQRHDWVRSEMEDAIRAEVEELNELRQQMGDEDPLVVHL